ncbi:MAG: hypothetical protein NTV56_24830 [Alphaproteobacteria bacterium]|nr:hypothetical protein [Alphaproteobacteria bacterium]
MLLLLPLHIMAMLALGLLIGQQGWRRVVTAAYATAVAAGLMAIALAYVPRFASECLLTATVLAGLMLALARPCPGWGGVALAATIGTSLAVDSPPETISLREANLTLAGIWVGACVAVWLVAALSVRCQRTWQRLGIRVAGSWIAASAILVLALRLVR